MLEHNLLKLNVNEHTEKKQNLTYLSWAWAWAEALKVDASATFHVRTFENKDGVEQCWMDVNGTAMVWVSVILGSVPVSVSCPSWITATSPSKTRMRSKSTLRSCVA